MDDGVREQARALAEEIQHQGSAMAKELEAEAPAVARLETMADQVEEALDEVRHLFAEIRVGPRASGAAGTI